MRVTKDGIVGNSRPCNNCIRKLSNIIYRIYYTTKDGEIKCEKITKMMLTHTSVGNRDHDRAIQTILSSKANSKGQIQNESGIT